MSIDEYDRLTFRECRTMMQMAISQQGHYVHFPRYQLDQLQSIEHLFKL